MVPSVGRLAQEYDSITEYWSPRVVAAANGQFVKLAKAKGEFVWHAHAEEDEFFLVHRGTFAIRYRGGREVVLRAGDFHVVPQGVEHQPYADEEAWIMFVEPARTKHTGDVQAAVTRSIEEQTIHLRS